MPNGQDANGTNPVQASNCYRARVSIADVTEDQLHEVFRQYLEDRVNSDAGGNHAEFGRKTGIARAVISRALAGGGKDGSGGVSMGMLLRIANTVGPKLPDMFVDIAKRCAAAELDARAFPTLSTKRGRAVVRAEDARLVQAALPEAERDLTAERPATDRDEGPHEGELSLDEQQSRRPAATRRRPYRRS